LIPPIVIPNPNLPSTRNTNPSTNTPHCPKTASKMSAAKVNKPTDIKQKEADVNRKLQIYGIISAFQNGKVPSVCEPTNNLRERDRP